MKAASLIISIFLIVNSVASQDFNLFKDFYTGKKTISKIQDIRTKNDFNQTSLSSGQIDERIKSLITSIPVLEIDAPINFGKLKYWGKKNPIKEIDFDSLSFSRDMYMIDKELEIYSYDGVWILVPDKSNKSCLNVFYAARAMQIIQVKYPEAYNTLVKPDQRKLGKDYHSLHPEALQPNVIRLVPILSFDKSPTAIAGSLWNKKWATGPPTINYGTAQVYENTLNVLTSIDYEKGRPAQIYENPDSLKNYWLYLKEGLVESIVHEFIHHYISSMAFSAFDKKADYIYQRRYATDDPKFSVDVEEGIVLNTDGNYFKEKGGLSSTLARYYDNKLQAKMLIVSDTSIAINKNRQRNLKNLSPPTSTTFDKIFRLDIFSYNLISEGNNQRQMQLEQQLEQQRVQEEIFKEKMKDPEFRKLIETQERMRQQQMNQQRIQQDQQMNIQQNQNPLNWQQIQQPIGE